jgi:hypothetical protein
MRNGIEIIDDSQKCITDLMSDPKVFPNAVIHHQTTIANISTPSHHHQAYCNFFKQYYSFPPSPNTSLLKCHQLLPCLIVALPCCCFALLLPFASCVSPVGTSTLPFFLAGFGFWSLKKQATTI